MAIALASGACSSTTSTATGVIPATAIVVDPAEFLGDVICGVGPGEMRRYVATLVDVSGLPEAGIPEIEMPSSPPTPCYQKIQFERITPGREYSAKIQGYDRTDLRPSAPGSLVMVDGTGAYVPPRWTTTCGGRQQLADGGAILVDGGTPARDGSIGVFDDCRRQLLPDGGPTGDLGGPACAYTYLTIVLRDCAPLEEIKGP